MRLLTQALQDHELIVLRVIGEWWDLDLTGSDKSACIRELASALAKLDLPQEIQYLQSDEAAAMQAIIQAGGRMPVATFARDHGDVRLMGPGRLEREEPWFDPANPAEALWYRGFLYRGFDETAEGVIEFFYLPEEFLQQFPRQPKQNAPEHETAVKQAPVKLSAVKETILRETAVLEPPISSLKPVPAPAVPSASLTDAVDDLTTLLLLAQQAILQLKQPDAINPFLLNADKDRTSLLLNLALEMGFLVMQEDELRPLGTAVAWLQKSRDAQLRALAEAWSSSNWNELGHTPGLRCEGDQWHNDPILARTALLDALPRTADWYALDDLAAFVKSHDPDFQRPDGNYDTWYVRELETGVYLNGFDNWVKVEGRLLRFLVQGPMVWLGLAATAVHENRALFALTDRALEWLADTLPETHDVTTPIIVQADCTLSVPRQASRFHRFQAGRISELLPVTPGQPYQFRLTPASLAQAHKQGITAERMLQFLEEASSPPLPSSVKRAITRWAEKGPEGRLETAVILRVRDGAILDTLRTNPKTRLFLGESLGDLAVAVPAQNWENLRTAVAQLGLLLDVAIE